MTEKHTELSQRLVVGHKRDGRSCYDKEAKRELIEACLRPGVSVARTALQHGINANLLRTWITRYRRQRELIVGRPAVEMAAPAVGSVFVPVVTSGVPARSSDCDMARSCPTGSNWI
jgi:transposase